MVEGRPMMILMMVFKEFVGVESYLFSLLCFTLESVRLAFVPSLCSVARRRYVVGRSSLKRLHGMIPQSEGEILSPLKKSPR
jgi:hypothetical protein